MKRPFAERLSAVEAAIAKLAESLPAKIEQRDAKIIEVVRAIEEKLADVEARLKALETRP